MRIVTPGLFACGPVAASAPPRLARTEDPCQADAQALCHKALVARDRGALKACLLRLVPRLSPPCSDLIAKTAGAEPSKPARQR